MKDTTMKLFDTAFEAMGKEVENQGVKGVGVVAYLEDESTCNWEQMIHVFGKVEIPTDGDNLGWNLIGMACSKASESISSKNPSGDKSRAFLHGEVGFQGAAVRKVGKGYVVAAFGGGADAQDYEVGKAGVRAMADALN